MKSRAVIALIIIFNFILSVPLNVYADSNTGSKGKIIVDVSSDSDTSEKEGVKVGAVYVAGTDGKLRTALFSFCRCPKRKRLRRIRRAIFRGY